MPKKLLVADDSLTIQKVIELIFENDQGVELINVSNGEEAIAKAKEISPDLILLDADMPDKSGYEVSKEITADPNLKDVPVILMISKYKEVNESDISAAGAADHIVKPFGGEDLVNKVNAIVGVSEKLSEDISLSEEAEGVETLDVEIEVPEVAEADEAIELGKPEEVEALEVEEEAIEAEEIPDDDLSFSAIEEISSEEEEEKGVADWSVASVEDISETEDLILEEEPEALVLEEAVEAEEVEAEEAWDVSEFSASEGEQPLELEEVGEESAIEAGTEEPEEAWDVDEFKSSEEEAVEAEEVEALEIEEEAVEAEDVEALEIEEEAVEAEEVEALEIEEEAVEAEDVEALEIEEEAVEADIDVDSVKDAVSAKLTDIISDEFVKNIANEVVRDVIENVVWEVVPELAERLIKEEIERLKNEE
ncbi:PleD family two-component system response regulator [Thermodesulfobacteriota bacterium]